MPSPTPNAVDATDAVDALIGLGVQRGHPVGIALAADGIGLAGGEWTLEITSDSPATCIAAIDSALRPRWVCWSNTTAAELVRDGTRLATCWDIAAVHRLLFGGWQAGPARVWAMLHDLDPLRIPTLGQLDLLFGAAGDGGGDPDSAVQPDGHLRPEWVAGSWRASGQLAAEWAATAVRAAALQGRRLAELSGAGSVVGDPAATARVESTAELLCVELAADGLPVDRRIAARLLGELVGPRPADEMEAEAQRRRRDDAVLCHLPPGSGIDLRNPADVRNMLRRLGIDVPDTRAWRLEAMRSAHPAIEALLSWRKAERIANTFGYGWLDTHVGPDGRLRGEWSGSDGAAGRMTALAGLHNLPSDLRPIVVAEPGHLFVRADLGQIEPRVLAAVSGDQALTRATQDDDLYAPVARRLGVERPVAKVAMLAAMYGQTSGTAGRALRGMEKAFPVAIKYLDDAARAGVQGRDLRTFGGRLIRMHLGDDDAEPGSVAAARGRYARNAMVQGAAAELFKQWAVTVRARGAGLQARIVLCLHDELLLHVPEDNAAAAGALLGTCLEEAAQRWQPLYPTGSLRVRFVADVAIVHTWAEAKG